MMVLVLGWLSCMSADVLPELSPPLAEMSVIVDAAAVPSGEGVVVEVQALAAEGWSVEAGQPFSEGLTVELLSEVGPVAVGERSVLTRRYALKGPDGSYVVGTTEGHAVGPADEKRSFEAAPVFVDIGVEGPNGGPMDGFADTPPPPPDNTWAVIMIVAGVLTLVGLLWWWRRRRTQRNILAAPPVPPHILAQGAWAEARSTITEDHPLAVRLSMVLREYLEARSGFPASKATSVEIGSAMEQLGIDGRPVGAELWHGIAQILDATDRLKFARQGGGTEFFAAMDTHFQAIINQTRPVPIEPDDA
jgi:hypothetical protein